MWKVYSPDASFYFPVYLEPDVNKYLNQLAEEKQTFKKSSISGCAPTFDSLGARGEKIDRDAAFKLQPTLVIKYSHYTLEKR